MKKNKSIDGLTVRDSESSSLLSPKPAKTIKTTKSIKTKKVVVATPVKKAPSKPIEVTEAKPVITKKGPAITEPTQETTPQVEQEPQTKQQAVEDFLKPVHAFDFDGETGELKASTKKADKKAAKKADKKLTKEKKKPSKMRRIITSIILLIVLTLIGLVTWAVFWGNDIIAKITGGQGNVFDLIKFVEPTYEPLKTDSNGRTNILAFGTSGYNMEGDEGGGVHAGAQLTDSIMVISLNQDTGDFAMLSLPRDLKASPTCTATGKINEVYWCNNMYGEDEAGGAEALMAEVSSILGIDFQYYIHVNWGSLVSIVDILDGIDVTLDEYVIDASGTGLNFEPGVTYHIYGEDALALARARKGTMGGDFSRGASQQKILIGIKDKVLAKDLSITDIIGLASTLGDNLRSNLSIDELKTMAHLTFDFDFDDMRQISLYDIPNGIFYMTTGTLDNGISYVFPSAGVGNYYAIQEYVAEQLSNDPRIYEHPSIIILNATGEAGVAGKERDTLTEAGYYINDVDNAPEGATFSDNYTIYVNGDNVSGTKGYLEKQYNITARPISDAPESITRDYNFVIVIGPTPKPETE